MSWALHCKEKVREHSWLTTQTLEAQVVLMGDRGDERLRVLWCTWGIVALGSCLQKEGDSRFKLS